MFMPSAVEPGMSVAEAGKALQVEDKILMTFPEVGRVFGKAGRAGTATDPAPLSMFETMKFLALSVKNARWDATAATAPQILSAATEGCARALGINSGAIEEGKLAAGKWLAFP